MSCGTYPQPIHRGASKGMQEMGRILILAVPTLAGPVKMPLGLASCESWPQTQLHLGRVLSPLPTGSLHMAVSFKGRNIAS